MRIGDKVVSQKIGSPLVGEVFGLADARRWARMNPGNRPHWFRHYPDWLDKQVVFVHSETPYRSLTKDEFIEGLDEHSFITEFDYEDMVPPVHHFVLPEDDVLLRDEIE